MNLTPFLARMTPVFALTVLALYAVLIGEWIGMSQGLIDPLKRPIGADFVGVYAASAQALQGQPAAIYDFGRHALAEQAAVGDPGIPYWSWLYPPTFLLAVLPLALLPYAWALVVYMAATFAAYVVALRRLAPAKSESLWLIAAFPAVFTTLAHGQNGFLTTALLGGALLLLDRRPILAGVLIGLLTYKPQLGLAIPLVLAVSMRWRVFTAAAVTAAAFALASYAVFGLETWTAFQASLPIAHGYVLEQGAIGWEKLQSTFGAVRMLGGGIGAAYAAQGVVTVAALAALAWIWWRHDGPMALAALPIGALLATPYVLDYDLTLLAIPIAVLAGEGLRTGFLSFEKAVLAAAWVLPVVSREIALKTGVSPGPILLGAFLLITLRRAAVSPRLPESPEGRLI